MIVCFNCTADTKDELDRLIMVGSYRDYGEAIAAAVRNQVLMEKEVVEKGSIVIGGPARPEVSSETKPAELKVKAKTKIPSVISRKKNEKTVNPGRNGTVTQLEPASIPDLFKLEGFPNEAPHGLAELPTDMWAPGQVVPLDRWVLGQQNRLLPAKVNARALIRLFQDSREGLSINTTAETVAASAAVFGDYLLFLDKARMGSRDEALATAFPTTAEDADKGRTRFANQFVVYQNGRGELSGLMVDLKLVNVVTLRKERLIVPTRVAWEFARLPNPLLDGVVEGEVDKFSRAERSFLLKHISSSVPVEAFAYRAVLEAVRAEENTPDKIDAALKMYVSEDRAERLSHSFLASQRSGAVSRMSDLGLIGRQREGTRVSYVLTEEGRVFLAQYVAPTQ